jgi:hypothetical protein
MPFQVAVHTMKIKHLLNKFKIYFIFFPSNIYYYCYYYY